MNNPTKIFFATRARGFFRHLFQSKAIKAQFVYNKSSIYETKPKYKLMISKILHWEIFDWGGVIQIIRCKNTGCDIHGSFNRFLNSDKPYFIYVENPTAPYNYCLGRNRTLLGKRIVTKKLNDPHLKAIIYMSDACRDTFQELCGPIASGCHRERIYPFIPKNQYVSEAQIRAKRSRAEVKLLYIAQGIRFLSKGALEVVEAFKRLNSNGMKCSLTMVTNLSEVDKAVLQPIRETPGITLYDFAFSYEEMEKLYTDHDILLQPSSDDSCPLTVFEALHAGMAFVASRLYAIPEVVQDGVNGFLIDPAHWLFDRNNMPNRDIWKDPRKTIHSGKRSESVTQALYDRLSQMLEDRELVERMALQSYKMAQSAPFSQEHIAQQWNNLLTTLNLQKQDAR